MKRRVDPKFQLGQGKYIKIYKTRKELVEIYSDSVDRREAEIIKNYYLDLGGDWIVQPGLTSNETDKIIYVPDHVDQDNERFMLLWEKAVIKYLDSIYLYDEHAISYLIEQKPNPNWPFISLYIDTIPTNFWLESLYKLGTIFNKTSKAPAQIIPEIPLNKAGKPLEPCCDKYIPFNYLDIFGIPLPKISMLDVLDLFTVDIPVMDSNQGPGKFKTENGKTVYKKDQIALNDGIIYIPIGAEIKLQYTGAIPTSGRYFNSTESDQNTDLH